MRPGLAEVKFGKIELRCGEGEWTMGRGWQGGVGVAGAGWHGAAAL